MISIRPAGTARKMVKFYRCAQTPCESGRVFMEYRWSSGLQQFEDAAGIRRRVFIEEQGFLEEFDKTDRTARHVTAYLGGLPVAAARLFPTGGGVYHIGRVAVRREYRGRHLGAELMREVIRKARELGAARVELDAPRQAAGFYEKLGFQPFGAPYCEQGCPHINMALDFSG